MKKTKKIVGKSEKGSKKKTEKQDRNLQASKVLIQKEKKEMVNGREIILQKQRKYYITDARSGFTNQFGSISGKDLSQYGQNGAGIVKSSSGKEFFVFPAGFIDRYRRIKRLPQTIPLKDIGIILSETGIGPESIVLESGTGSGAVSCFIARYVKKIITYEIRQDFASAAQQNIIDLGLKNIVLKNKDFYTECDEPKNSFDLIILDLPEPWRAIETAELHTKPGGFIVSYSPNISQAADMVNAIKQREKLIHTKTVEIMEREWEIDSRKVRPKNKSMIHSGYLSFARKISE